MKKLFLLTLCLMLGLTIVACNNVKEDEEVNENVDETKTEEVVLETSTDFDVDVKSDDNTMVIEIADNLKMVFYHDGTNVTKEVNYITYPDTQTAELAKAAVKVEGLDTEMIKTITSHGKVLEIEVKEESFEFKTVAELKEYEEQFKLVSQYLNK
ncbi:MAG: hypothetical protein MJ245_01830 [Clostridia bacterium]|nr:hypothetical protein [Clostridia bacterium]